MLSRPHRLTTTTFARAFADTKIARHPLLSVRVSPRNDGNSTVRAAFVSPKKLGKACVRNRARRQVRERFRLSGALENSQLRGCDLIYVLSAPVLNASQAQVDEALRELERRAAKLASNAQREKSNGASAQSSSTS